MRVITGFVVIALGLAGAAEATVQQAAPAAAPAVSPAMAAATLNRARMKTRPEAIAMPPPEYPESERAALHGGTVMVRGILGVDGKLSELSISRSSGFPALDAAALDAARLSTFSPAKDADGAPIAISVSVPETFDPKDTHAVVITAVSPDYPDAERAAGHHGKVEISGTIGPDGRLIDAKIATSSRAPGLDAAALAAARATLFRVRRDAAGKPIPQQATLPFTFDSYHSPGAGGGILRYRCDQFVKDQDWWRATWPASEHDEFFFMMLGLRTVVEMGARPHGRGNGQRVGQRPEAALDQEHRGMPREAGRAVHRYAQARRRLGAAVGGQGPVTRTGVRDGGCACGAVRYRMTGAPLFVHCCHCTACQTETGSAFVINALIESDRVETITGAPEPVMTPSESGKGQQIWRCPTCRVALWSNYGGAGDLLRFVRVGTLDAPGDLPPDIHIYTRSKLPWVELPQGVPAVEAYYDSRALWPEASLERRKALFG